MTITEINGSLGLNKVDLCVRPIELYYDETYIAHGTCFLWRYKNRTVAITSLHNLNGKDIFTDKNISPKGAIPNRAKIEIIRFGPTLEETGQIEGIRLLDKFSIDFKLIDDLGKFTWKEPLPQINQKCDIAIIDLCDNFTSHRVFNDIKFADVFYDNGQDVFVCGFPYKKSTEHVWELIWKRGSIATNPRYPWRGQDCFLIDATTTSGMSGSPVFVRKFGPTLIESNGGINFDLMDTSLMHTRFLGLYGGHISGEMNLNIGIVWKCIDIDRMIKESK